MTISDQVEYSAFCTFGIDLDITVMPRNMNYTLPDNPIPSYAETKRYGLSSQDANNNRGMAIHHKNHKYESKESKKDRVGK